MASEAVPCVFLAGPASSAPHNAERHRRYGTGLAFWGIVAGIFVGSGAARIVSAQLFGAGSSDVLTMALIVVLLLLVTLAAWLHSPRAGRCVSIRWSPYDTNSCPWRGVLTEKSQSLQGKPCLTLPKNLACGPAQNRWELAWA